MTLFRKQFGSGDRLIMVHGLFGTSDNWQTLAKRFGEEYTVFTVDQRNHGRSPHTLEHSYVLMAEDLRVFMESQFVFKAHVLGHSMGGKTAMRFALSYPDMVDKLIVADRASIPGRVVTAVSRASSRAMRNSRGPAARG